MKTLNISICLIIALSVFACSDKDYVSNDPNAAPDAPVCYDVNDLFQSYSLFYKPSHGWVGDPMPFYENGEFHMFYLQDARDGKPTFHPWYKASTSDFVTYKDDGEMIACGTVEQQDGALGTGSVFKHNGVYYAFYTGHNGKLDPREKILLATSTDMKTWTKDKNFELQASDGYDRNEFRDPIIIRDETSNTFKMLLSTRADYKGSWRAVIAQYNSTDLKNWKLEEPFYDDASTFMIECPDVFVEGNYQYLIYSNIDDNDRMVHYKYRKTGTTDWTTPKTSNLDSRAYYAAKSASNGKDRFLFGWCPTREENNDYSNFGWAGSLIVHQITQNADGTLDVSLPKSISDKLNHANTLKTTSSLGAQVSSSTYTLDGTKEKAFNVFERTEGAYKISTTIEPKTATRFGFELGACGSRREIFTLIFDLAANKLNLEKVEDGVKTILTSVELAIFQQDKLTVSLVVENSVCTIYVNDKIAFTNRIYKMNQNPWAICAEDGMVSFSNLELKK